MDWGSIPDWIAGVGTAGALLLTWRLLKHELEASRAERQARATDELRREADQAACVSSWLEDLDPQIHGAQGWVVWVSNSSSSPVYNCLVEVSEILGDGDQRAHFSSVPPGRPLSARLSRELFGGVVTIGDCNTQVRFTDASGRHWQRNWYGELVRHSEGVRTC